MRISVIGAIVHDEITTADGARRESFGGITYNMAALSSIVSDDTSICPIANVAEDRWDEVVELLARYPLVTTDDVQRVPGKLTAAKLVYTSPTWRDETVLHPMRPLTTERLTGAFDSDAVLVNFINGSELDLETFAALRENARGFLHLDVHSKVAHWDAEGKKSQVPFEGWQEWLSRVDAAQMNEFECEMTVGRKLREQQDFVQAGAEIVEACSAKRRAGGHGEAGAPIVLITLGPLGSVLVYRRADGIFWVANPALAVEQVVDTTGCGDSFSAGFLWNYFQCREPAKANAAANIVAGVNCTVAGIGHLEAARGALERIPTAFPELGARIMAGWPGEKL
ncbi:MAG: carbohydrate kinase family protein [Armatimonadota bacterium]|nr:MAG: carbohydrate kinase family protein [Armatimonadota bacterium]